MRAARPALIITLREVIVCMMLDEIIVPT